MPARQFFAHLRADGFLVSVEYFGAFDGNIEVAVVDRFDFNGQLDAALLIFALSVTGHAVHRKTSLGESFLKETKIFRPI